MRIVTTVIAAALSSGLAAPASAQIFGEDVERIQTAIEAGRIAPLRFVLAAAKPDAGLHVTEVELEEDDDAPSGWLYEVEYVTPEGEREIEIDARSGEILDD